MKIVAYGASTSSTSINKALATYTAGLVDGAEVKVLDINDYDVPMFSEDLEKQIEVMINILGGKSKLKIDDVATMGYPPGHITTKPGRF